MGLSLPICEMQRLGWKPMKDSPRLMFNDSFLESKRKEGKWSRLWSELCLPNLHPDVEVLTSEWDCIWRQIL